MRNLTQVKSISYLKANAAEVLRQIGESRKALVITQYGEAKAVLQDVASYEETQEAMALLKILAIGQREIEAGLVQTAETTFKQIRVRKAPRNG